MNKGHKIQNDENNETVKKELEVLSEPAQMCDRSGIDLPTMCRSHNTCYGHAKVNDSEDQGLYNPN